MSEHVGSEILDFVERRLDEARMREIQRHLDTCEDCAADVAFARELREQAAAQGLRHLPPERVVALAAGDSPSAEERGHLDGCSACREEVAWAERQDPIDTILPAVAPPEIGPSPSARGERRGPAWQWIWGGVTAAAAALAVFFLLPLDRGTEPQPPVPAPVPPRTSPPPSIAGLARLDPLPVRLTRAPAEPGFDEERVAGLEAYQAADYPAAIEHFRRALAVRPAHDETALYLGSAELMTRNATAAEATLAPLAERAPDPVIRSEALWRLANARVLLEREADALATLRLLRDLGGERDTDAAALIAAIERARP